jgi:hypothetical protein
MHTQQHTCKQQICYYVTPEQETKTRTFRRCNHKKTRISAILTITGGRQNCSRVTQDAAASTLVFHERTLKMARNLVRLNNNEFQRRTYKAIKQSICLCVTPRKRHQRGRSVVYVQDDTVTAMITNTGQQPICKHVIPICSHVTPVPVTTMMALQGEELPNAYYHGHTMACFATLTTTKRPPAMAFPGRLCKKERLSAILTNTFARRNRVCNISKLPVNN